MRIRANRKNLLTAFPRQGYALLVCLFVAAISSTALLGILNVARFETLEVSAKQRSAAAMWAATAGAERAVAMLLDNPNLQGTLPAVEIPARSGTRVASDIQVDGQTITVTATATVGGISKTHQLVFTNTQLQQRIANLK
jgi:type II secretory pathway component PulK